ncbi:hypothetical protein JRO89_XS02G0232700 [Xanthoceras sorbifolium]|uniref:Polygalacturonase n=1 Tax=Xanthoceras sorbifolium TaxID=99658 RepID=A0ABQ8IGP4_9ROSI|nr:hypothetical protein JRO89_XS02G0232700 [Xanthoceras sorbifolium]
MPVTGFFSSMLMEFPSPVGFLTAKGLVLWACKNSGNNCPSGATSLGFSNSNNIVINGLTSLNSQMYHIVFNGCNNVKVQGVKVSASGKARTPMASTFSYPAVSQFLTPRSPPETIVSPLPWNQRLMDRKRCLCIGSLGKNSEEPGVQNVTVKTATFTGTQNGLRIKSWGRPSNGFARNILFQHAVMQNVQNPIIIDQNYCPDNKGCPGQVSGVQISDVTYQDIHGTSATEVAVNLDCSSKNPCSRIKLQDVKLTYNNQPASASCSHADGSANGVVQTGKLPVDIICSIIN